MSEVVVAMPAMPVLVNGLRVLSAIKLPTNAGEVPHMWIVLCLDDRRHSGYGHVVWTVGYDRGPGSYVAMNGRYDMSFVRATEVLIDRATR